MIIGTLQLELTIDHAQSLKDKRRVVMSIKDRLHREHQVSVAEVAQQDNCRVAQLGIAMAASSVPNCQSTLDAILKKVEHHRDCVLSDHKLEILTGR
jgi:hypothetical protein